MLFLKSKLYEKNIFNFCISQLVFNVKLKKRFFLKDYLFNNDIFLHRNNVQEIYKRTERYIDFCAWDIVDCEIPVCIYFYDILDQDDEDFSEILGLMLANRRYVICKYILNNYDIGNKQNPLCRIIEENPLKDIVFLISFFSRKNPIEISEVFVTACEYMKKDVVEYFLKNYRISQDDIWKGVTKNLRRILLYENESKERRKFADYLSEHITQWKHDCILTRDYVEKFKSLKK